MRLDIDGANGKVLDENGNELLAFVVVGSAVNQVQLTNSATGNSVKISGVGDDTNITVEIIPKGTGAVKVTGPLNVTGALDHDGSTVGFFGTAPATKPTALTAADAGVANSGDATTDGVIDNLRTRLGELETKLQSLGLLS